MKEVASTTGVILQRVKRQRFFPSQRWLTGLKRLLILMLSRNLKMSPMVKIKRMKKLKRMNNPKK